MSRVNELRAAIQPVLPARQRSPGRVALDLWRAGGSFRGFTEFALIGAIVLAFLLTGGGKINFGSAGRTSTPGANAITALVAQKAQPARFRTPREPRISDVWFGPSALDQVAAPR